MEEKRDDTVPTRMRHLPSWLLTQSALRASRMVAAGFATAGARGYHYRILAALDEYGAMSQAELGRRCGIDRSDVVAMVNELVEQESVERKSDPGDRRRNVITITSEGVQRLSQLSEILMKIQDELLAPLTEEERPQLTMLLERLRSHHAP